MSANGSTHEDFIRLLFENPGLPIYTLESSKRESFEIEEGSMFLADRLKENFRLYQQHHVDTSLVKICLNDIPPPTFRPSMSLKDDMSQFVNSHTRDASTLIGIFNGAQTLDHLLSLAAFYRDRINPQLFYYALSISTMHRKGIKPIIGNVVSAFPYKFISAVTLRKAINDRSQYLPITAENPVDMAEPECSIDPEARMNYFREDLGVNIHHWHWHLVYVNTVEATNKSLIDKDRRGELFYYMHQQMLARYDAERLSNNLNRLKPIDNFRKTKLEGYYSNLQIQDGSTTPGRPADMVLTDIVRSRDGMVVTISNLEDFVLRVNKAIDDGCYKDGDDNRADTHSHRYKKMTIDVLGNMVEASDLSPNKAFYGDIHTYGHLLIGLIHDPEKKFGKGFGVMGDVATAVRDPVFYRWHKFVDNLLNRFKINTTHNPSYTRQQLTFPGVVINSAELKSAAYIHYKAKKNELVTFFGQSVIKINGLDFQNTQSAYVRVKHLNHVQFTYTINFTNNGHPRRANIRIFIAPKFDECGAQFNLREQRRLFIEMNRQTITMNTGGNEYNELSTKTSVTIPHNQTFPKVLVDTTTKETVDSCTCGWPHHMLLPKGKPEGMTYQMFVMITDYEKDKVVAGGSPDECTTASSFCGIKSQKYPDKNDMGYPFDREINVTAYKTIEEFVKGENSAKINMFVMDFTIRHVPTV